MLSVPAVSVPRFLVVRYTLSDPNHASHWRSSAGTSDASGLQSHVVVPSLEAQFVTAPSHSDDNASWPFGPITKSSSPPPLPTPAPAPTAAAACVPSGSPV